MDVLIIDSDEGFAAHLRDSLQARGVATSVHTDGEAALSQARSRPPRAVVLSLELGDRPSAGFSWCNRFKRDDLLRGVPLVLTSTLATAETFEHHKRLKTRADAYLHKPFAPARLLAELEQWLPVDAPPAGSVEALADELLGDEDIETVEPDELETSPLDDLLEEVEAAPVEEIFAPGAPPPAPEMLDDLVSDLGSTADLERTVVAFARPAFEPEPEPAPAPAAAAASDAHVRALEADLAAARAESQDRAEQIVRMRDELEHTAAALDAAQVEADHLRREVEALRAELRGEQDRRARAQEALAKLQAILA